MKLCPNKIRLVMKPWTGLLLAALYCLLPEPTTAAKFASEYELLRQLPSAVLSGLITNTGSPDAQGYIGFHQQNRQWFEAGMQRGGCWMLIGAVVAGDVRHADDAWRSIETTFAHQVEDGGFQSNPKPEATHAPTRAEREETAFFYLQELGHALLVVQQSPMESHFHDRIVALQPKLRRACDFIQSGFDLIQPKVGHTANRLFIAAKAFGLCGVLLKDEQLQSSARKLVAAGLLKRDREGVFVENGGRDSSYTAVSLLMGQVLSMHLPLSEVDTAMVPAMTWLRTRIRSDGEVEVKDNTRTGVGKEVFMGKPKGVNYREVALAFMYYGMLHQDPEALRLAEKVVHYSSDPANRK